jgi:hypothetical protein
MTPKKLPPIERLMREAARHADVCGEVSLLTGRRIELLQNGKGGEEAKVWEREVKAMDAVERSEKKMRREFLAVLREARDDA